MPEIKWCNNMRSVSCCFMYESGSKCKFMHIDQFVLLEKEEKSGFTVQSIMDVHAKQLTESYYKAMLESVRTGGVTYAGMERKLIEEGWSNRTEECPKEFFQKIVKLVVNTLHYDLHGAADIMLRTIKLLEGVFSPVPAQRFVYAPRHRAHPSVIPPTVIPPPSSPPHVVTHCCYSPDNSFLHSTSLPPTPVSESHDPLSPAAEEDEELIDVEQVAMYLMAI
eukprot:TRINITY_DN31754_c0_g1_i1.p1 TRINITY_DN31754_c0_g1~~TRINITY_DN31754_c0_g1_i1.p1  ORF type:complete len:222 (+),score=40.67 TRINITY_DN31754_c0_g1_i1:55-720(+)